MKKTAPSFDPGLERLLRKGADAPLPKGLRRRTLQRLGLAPAAPAWSPWLRVLAPAGLAALLALTLLQPPRPCGLPKAAAPLCRHAEASAPAPHRCARPSGAQPSRGRALVQAPAPSTAAAQAPVGAPAQASAEPAPPAQAAPGQAALGGGHPLSGAAPAVAAAPASTAFAGSSSAIGAAKAGSSTARGRRGPSFRALPGLLKPGQTLTLEAVLDLGGQATLRILDAQGREVALLQDGPLAPGEHRFRWDPAGAASGAYTAVLTAPGRMDKARILVVR